MRGVTLFEIAFVLALLTVVMGAVVPVGRDAVDRLAVTSAREALIGLVARCRAAAVTGGGARLVVDPEAGLARVERDTVVVGQVDFGASWGVSITTPGRGRDVLIFGPLGIGVLANRTLVLERGRASAGVIVSSLGRTRRR